MTKHDNYILFLVNLRTVDCHNATMYVAMEKPSLACMLIHYPMCMINHLATIELN